MTVGIDVNVSTGKVKAAKKDVEALNKELRQTEGFEIPALGKGDLSESSSIVKKISEDIRKMKGISLSGERQGGLLRKDQFEQAAVLSKRIGENFRSYHQDLQKAKNELTKLLQEQTRLEQRGKSAKYESPADFEKRESRLQEIQDQIAGKRKAYEGLTKHEARMRALAQGGADASESVGGYGMAGGRGMLGMGLRKALGMGTALLGGFSILNFLSESLGSAANFGAGNADMMMRGAKGNLRGPAATLGYMPMEALAVQEILNGKTGFTGQGLNDASLTAMVYGRKTGIGAESIAEYMGGSFPSTGATGKQFNKQLQYLHDTAVALGQRGRIEEILRYNQQVMATIVSGRGGKELSAAEMTGTLAMQMALMSLPGQIGKGGSGANILSSIDAGIRGGGKTPGQQIFLAQALGIEGVNSMSGLWDFRKRMSDGLTPDNLRATLNYADKVAQDRGLSPKDSQIFAMMNIRDVFGLNEYQTEAIFSPGFREALNNSPEAAMKALQNTAEGKKNLKALHDWRGLPGNAHRRTVAGVENLKVDTGELLLPYVDSFKSGMVGAVNSFRKGKIIDGLGSMVDNPLGKLMVGGMLLQGGSSLLSGGGGFLGGAAAGAGARGLGRLGLSLLGPAGAGIAAGAYVMGPTDAGFKGEDEIMRRINAGESPEAAERAVRAQEAKGSGELGGLTAAIWELVRTLTTWMHQTNQRMGSSHGASSPGAYP